MAEADRNGHVNVSRFGPKLAGAGGFINISQNARCVVFAGTFTTGGASIHLSDGELVIEKDGATSKFVNAVGQITFSGTRAAHDGRRILYVTERCVFELKRDGPALIEIAPGVDIDRDVLGRMEFRPRVDEIAVMDERIFKADTMGLQTDLLHLDLADRIALDGEHHRLFVNFEKMRVRSQVDIDMIREQVETVCKPLDQRVDVIVNYDGARIDDDISEDYAEMVRGLEDRFYGTVTRYSGSAFMRMKLGESLRRATPPHIFETAEEARSYLKHKDDT